MIRQRLIQIISHVPPHAQPIRHLSQEQAFGADVFKKHHQLELEKDHRINGWSPSHSVMLANEIVDEREIQRLLQLPVKMILGNQLLQGNGDQRGERPLFETHHGSCSSLSLLHRHFSLLSTSACPLFLFVCSFSSFTSISTLRNRHTVTLMDLPQAQQGVFQQAGLFYCVI